jgi:hypothetical protein
LNKLVSENPSRFLYFSGSDATHFLQENNITVLTVFVRDPIERFFSGLVTQCDLYDFDIDKILYVWEYGLFHRGHSQIHMFDAHTIPQFWYLLRATKIPNLKFDIVPLDYLSLIYPNREKINVSEKFDFGNVSPDLMSQINYYFTEDIVLHSHFQNKVVDLETIFSQIRLEKKFTEEYRSYYKMLTYL